jgi:hypothetical protein
MQYLKEAIGFIIGAGMMTYGVIGHSNKIKEITTNPRNIIEYKIKENYIKMHAPKEYKTIDNIITPYNTNGKNE